MDCRFGTGNGYHRNRVAKTSSCLAIAAVMCSGSTWKRFIDMTLQSRSIRFVPVNKTLSRSSTLTGLLTWDHHKPLILILSRWGTLLSSLVQTLLHLSDSCRQVLGHCPPSLRCRHTLTYVRTWAVTWKERKLCGTGSLAAADGLLYSQRPLSVHLLQRLARQRESRQVAFKTANHKSLPLYPVASSSPPSVFTCFNHMENSWLCSVLTSAPSGTYTPVTALTGLSVCIRNVGMKRWGRDEDDRFKNTPEQCKSTGDFCHQVHYKVI